MRKVNVADILGRNLMARALARDLKSYVDNSSEPCELDFSGVEFATRSFMDELYNQLVKNHAAGISGMSEDLSALLNAVKATQKGAKSKFIDPAEIHVPDSELDDFFAASRI